MVKCLHAEKALLQRRLNPHSPTVEERNKTFVGDGRVQTITHESVAAD